MQDTSLPPAVTQDLLEKYGPWAVIAGGSEGTGLSFAHELVAAGIHVLLVSRSAEGLASAAADLTSRHSGAEVRTLAADLTDPDVADRVAEATHDLDVGLLIVNAGANTLRGDFLDTSPDEVARLLALSITTPLELIRRFAPAMRDRGRGGVLLVGSLAGYIGHSDMTIYSGAKAFGRVFAEGLWLELKAVGVDVLHLVLGVTRTPAMERGGLRLDLPGLVVADPAEVAREGLAHLADGPVWVMSGNDQIVAHHSGTDRAALVSRQDRVTRKLTGR